MKKVGKFMILFGVFWSAMTLLFDGFMLVPVARQLIALRFSTTGGTMVSAEVTRHDDSDGDTFGVAMSYTYAVNGQDYTGNRYRYDTSSSSDSAWAHRAVNERPPGTQVTVYYNPSSPEDALLVPGLLGSDLFQLMFMTPFNAVMLGFWWAGWSRLRFRWFKPVAGGVRIISSQRQIIARLTTFSPLAAGLTTGGLLAFLSIFVVGFLGGGFHPTLRIMIWTWSVILGGGVVSIVWNMRQAFSGKYDLIIDEAEEALELPAIQGRKEIQRIRFEQIEAVQVETLQKPSSGDSEPVVVYVPTLRLTGATPAVEQLVEWYGAEKAEAFADWLRGKLPPPKKTPKRPLAGRFDDLNPSRED